MNCGPFYRTIMKLAGFLRIKSFTSLENFVFLTYNTLPYKLLRFEYFLLCKKVTFLKLKLNRNKCSKSQNMKL